MYQLTNENGIECVRLNVFQEDGQAWAIAVFWRRCVDGLPDERAFHEAIQSSVEECKKKGALCIDSRVITATEGLMRRYQRHALRFIAIPSRPLVSIGARIESNTAWISGMHLPRLRRGETRLSLSGLPSIRKASRISSGRPDCSMRQARVTRRHIPIRMHSDS
jgi:hypothetical protein